MDDAQTPATDNGHVVAASLPQRATVARIVEVEATGFRIAGPARIHTYRAGSLMLTDHGELVESPDDALSALHGGPEGRDSVQWLDGVGAGAFVSGSVLPDTVEGFVVADGRLWSVALTGKVGSTDPVRTVEALVREIAGAPQAT